MKRQDPFQLLLDAVVDDDRAKARELLETDSSLAHRSVDEPWLDSKVAHWIYKGDTALHVAAAGYRVDIAKILLAAGADVDAAKNHRNSQPLHYAADGCLQSDSWNAQRQVQMIKLLLKAGADVRVQDKNGATALHRAVRTRCAAAVQCLLDAGADATLRNLPGSTAFHLAVQNTGRGGSGADEAKTAQRKIIETFLEHGASPGLKDAKGKSVAEWARSGWIREILATGPG